LLAAACVAAVWCLAAILLPRGSRWSWSLSLLFNALLSALLTMQCTRRLWFILQHGGMDSADQPGSPMAFLIGWTLEIALLSPAVVFSIWLILRRGCLVART
jgi:hypothetical protein